MWQFCNQYSSELWVAIVRYTPNCYDGNDYLGDWTKEGWWHLNPGECKIVDGDDLEDVNRYYYYYAEAADGNYWAGPIPVAYIPQEAFNLCIDTGVEPSRELGFRELDIGDYDNYTINLVP